jgi:hypothetical protein
MNRLASRIAALEKARTGGGGCVCASWPPFTLADFVRWESKPDEPPRTPWLRHVHCPRCGREGVLKRLFDALERQDASRLED